MRASSILIALVFAGPVFAQGNNPYEPTENVYRPKLLIVGGSSSGTAAAITAGRLGVDTLLVMRAPRDLGGLSTNAINPDSDLPIRVLGGLALEYDVVARHTTGFNVGGRKGGGEGYFAPFHQLFRYTKAETDKLPALKIIADLYPVKVEKDPKTRRVMTVVFKHRLDPKRTVTVHPEIAIDAEIEGDVTHLAGATTTLRREGKVKSDDPTRDQESYAGRIFTPEKSLGSLLVAGGPITKDSTSAADDKPATMGWNGSISLQDYGKGAPDSPCILTTKPPGYDPKEFAWWKSGIYGVDMSSGHRRWNIDHYLSTVEGWRLPDGRHVLESMSIADREANEKSHLAHVIRGLWHLQHHLKQYQWGLSEFDFREGLPAKYRLSDLGTITYGGDAPLPGLIYMREGRRLVNDHVFGGKLIEDDGSGRFVQKRGWHHHSVYFNAMLVDIHGVHNERKPGSGPEGMQLLRLAGHHNFGAPCIPFEVLVPRPSEVTGLLVSSAGAYTHQAYAAFPRMETGRILQGHACAMAVSIALKDNVPVHEVDVRKVQLGLLELHGQSLAYFEDTIPGTEWHRIDQMLGCRRVPEFNDNGRFQDESGMTAAELRTALTRLFRDSHDRPVTQERLAAVTGKLGGHPTDKATDKVSRKAALESIATLAGLSPAKSAPACFVDAPADSALACLLAPCVDKGWIEPNVKHVFGPDEPMPFAEFKRYAYQSLFKGIGFAAPVDYRPWHFRDGFSRPDGPLAHIGRQPIRATIPWKVTGGHVMPTPAAVTGFLFVDPKTANVDVAVDIFLEQSKKPCAGGIVFRGESEKNVHRFWLEPKGEAIIVHIDRRENGEAIEIATKQRKTMRRGFTLRVVERGGDVRYFLSDEEVHRAKIAAAPAGTLVGLMNGGGEANRFDNFEVRDAD